jgi:iron complex transport system substrate-binding protein
VATLGKVSTLVGRDVYSTEPPSVRKLPSLGDFLTPNLEAIARLSPDLVILDESQNRTRQSLESLGLATLPLAMHQVDDVRKGLLQVGKAIDAENKAEELVAQLDASIAKYAAKGKARPVHPEVLLLIDRSADGMRNLVAAGPNTYLDELLNLVGATNMMAGSAVRYPQISADQILRASPDIIIDLSKSPSGVKAYEVIREASAVQEGRVHIVDESMLLSPTPRLADALARLYALTEMTQTKAP